MWLLSLLPSLTCHVQMDSEGGVYLTIQVERAGVVACVAGIWSLKGEECGCVLQCAVQAARGSEVKWVTVFAPLDTEVRDKLKELEALIIQRAKQMINRFWPGPNCVIVEMVWVHTGEVRG